MDDCKFQRSARIHFILLNKQRYLYVPAIYTLYTFILFRCCDLQVLFYAYPNCWQEFKSPIEYQPGRLLNNLHRMAIRCNNTINNTPGLYSSFSVYSLYFSMAPSPTSTRICTQNPRRYRHILVILTQCVYILYVYNGQNPGSTVDRCSVHRFTSRNGLAVVGRPLTIESGRH